jgi:hypothetical protein
VTGGPAGIHRSAVSGESEATLGAARHAEAVDGEQGAVELAGARMDTT